MKTLLQVTAATAVLLSVIGFTATVEAQNPAGANAQKHGVAVVDVSYIFENHARFRAAKEQMKKEIEAADGQVKADRDRLAQLEEQRNTYNVGSPEYKAADEELARNMAELNLKMGKLRKDFIEREAKVYYQTYLEVIDAVKYYAQRHDIGMVVRFNGARVDPNRREDVLREINKSVVYQNQVDITPDVLALLNRDAATAAPQSATRPVAPGSSLPRQ